jgi:hypothetical protein
MLVDYVIDVTSRPNNMRVSNVVGAMLDEASMVGDAQYMDAGAIPDEYTLEVLTLVGTVLGIKVTSASGKNPWDRTVSGFDIDAEGYFSDKLVPGVFIYFTGSTPPAVGDKSVIKVGSYGGAFINGGENAGDPSAAIRHRVNNEGTNPVTLCKARLLTQVLAAAKVTTHGSPIFISLRPYAVGAVEKTDADRRVVPYALKVVNVVRDAFFATSLDLQVDGVTLGAASIRNLTTDTLVSGVGLTVQTFASPYPYRIETGPLTGLEFVLHQQCEENDITNVLVFPSRYVQLAPDITGDPGVFALDDIDLGTIEAGSDAFYWSRIVVPDGANSISNPYPCNIYLEGTEDEAGSAGWDT